MSTSITKIFQPKSKEEQSKTSDSLVDEKSNVALWFIMTMAVLGILFIITYVYKDFITDGKRYNYSMVATLLLVAFSVFTTGAAIGFLFGIPRTISNDSGQGSDTKYAGNDNLLQISDWLTKILIGVGLTQLYEIPRLLIKAASYITRHTQIGNEALIVCVIIFYASLGFLFSYLWTRLYFIKMLKDSDDDVSAEVDKRITQQGLSNTNIEHVDNVTLVPQPQTTAEQPKEDPVKPPK